MAKVLVQTRHSVLIGTLSRIANKFHGEFFGTNPNDARLQFGFTKISQARKFAKSISIYECSLQVAS
jgi:hypothetical protein